MKWSLDKFFTQINLAFLKNSFVDAETTEAGVDDDFGHSATKMTAALEMAPYYAVRGTPAIHHTMDGLSVDTETHVLKADGTPIPGLFAADEVTGGLHGANRLCGNGVANIVVNG